MIVGIRDQKSKFASIFILFRAVANMVDALFPSEKKRDLKIKTIRGDEIQISIISFSATSIKNSTAASHLTGRGKKREGGGGGGKKERVTKSKERRGKSGERNTFDSR